MQIEVIQRGNQYYIRKICIMRSRHISRNWYQYYTQEHTWSLLLHEAKRFNSLEEATKFPERVVAIITIKDNYEVTKINEN